MSTNIQIERRERVYTNRKQHKDRIFPTAETPQFVEELPHNYVSPAGLTKRDLQERHKRIVHCGSHLRYIAYENGGQEELHPWHAANCNQHLACSVCAGKLEDRRQANVLPIINGKIDPETGERLPGLVDEIPYWYHITVTVENDTDLGETSKRLRDGLRAWRRAGQNGRDGEAAKIDAAILCQENKKGSGSGKWHPHVHILAGCSAQLDYSTYRTKEYHSLIKTYGRGKVPADKLLEVARQSIDYRGEQVASSKLSREWLRATKGRSMNIDVRPISPKDSAGNELAPEEYRDLVAKQVFEVIKYDSALEADSADEAMQIIAEMAGTRMYSTWGRFRNSGEPKCDSEAPGDWDDEDPPEDPRGSPLYILDCTYNEHRADFGDSEQIDIPRAELMPGWKFYKANMARLIASEKTHRKALVDRRGRDPEIWWKLNQQRDEYRKLYAQCKHLWTTAVMKESHHANTIQHTWGGLDIVPIPPPPVNMELPAIA